MPMLADAMILPAIPHLIMDFTMAYNTASWIPASFLITGGCYDAYCWIVITYVYGKKKMLLFLTRRNLYFDISVAAISANFIVMIVARIVQRVYNN